MPKIIENVRGKLLGETRKQIRENGYSHTTVRSISDACGIAIGTVYNYFPSKDHMVASYLYEEWEEMLEDVRSFPTDDPKAALCRLYRALSAYAEEHRPLFEDPRAAKVFASDTGEHRRMIRDQLSSLLIPICPEDSEERTSFLAHFLADSVLSFALKGEPFERIEPVLSKLIRQSGR